LGAALRTGLTASRGQLVVTTDSDGTYRFTGIPEMMSYLTPDVDIVTASPYHPKGGVAGVPKYRLVLSQGASMMYRVLVDYRVYTYTALFRAYRRQVIDQIQFQSDGFLGGTELMVKAMLTGYRVTEYPAVLHRRVFGTSKAKLARTIKAHLRFQGRILLYRLHLVPLDQSVKTKEANQWT
jgi:dolichol-phosphate mannosyltransferase